MSLSLRAISLLLIPASLLALDTKYSRQSLKGLTGINVVVDKVDPAVVKLGVDTAKIQTDVESKLKTAGIKVLSDAERIKTAGAPYLAVNINASPAKDGLVAFAISVSLLQGCVTARDASIKLPVCDTWSRTKVGHANTKVGSFLQELVDAEVDSFLKAFAEVNPKSK